MCIIFPFILFLSLVFFSQLFVRPPQTAIFLFCILFFLGMVLIAVSCTMSQISIHSSSGTLSIRSRSWWRGLPKCGPLEKGMANHFSILALRAYEQYEKAKGYDTERWTPQVGRCPICYWRTVKKQLQKEWRDRAKAKALPSCGMECTWLKNRWHHLMPPSQ